MKRVLTIQDLSCIGKCSLTVTLPVMSAMEIETVPLPTAVLSNHTAFSSFSYLDLTKEIPNILKAWGSDTSFDAIYSGYLGSAEQVFLVRQVWERFAEPGKIRFVDPVMGDHGKLYTGFDDQFVDLMRSLVAEADVVVPNLTEACILTKSKYREDGDADYYKEIAWKVAELGASRVVLTGFTYDQQLGALVYDKEKKLFSEALNEKIPASFHGTGDLFASVCLGALLRGVNLEEAAALATDYVCETLRRTQEDPQKRWYGVSFEKTIPYLITEMKRFPKKETDENAW